MASSSEVRETGSFPARERFIKESGGYITLENGWLHRRQALQDCAQMLDVSREHAVIVLYAVDYSKDLRLTTRDPKSKDNSELTRENC